MVPRILSAAQFFLFFTEQAVKTENQRAGAAERKEFICF
jgi:hypothetical protein